MSTRARVRIQLPDTYVWHIAPQYKGTVGRGYMRACCYAIVRLLTDEGLQRYIVQL